MKMDRVVCCEQCFSSIAEKSTACARLWLQMCEAAEPVRLSEIDLMNLRFLELWGFLVSTDAGDTICFKMKGRNESLEEIFYCCGEHYEQTL
jgi:hypothetical protein